MVFLARLEPARASAGIAGARPRRPLGAADRADRRRQDAGGVSADLGGALRARRQAAPDGFDRQGTAALGRPAHALHLAAEGARGRYRPQPRNAGPRNGPADPHRDPHRRYADLEASAPASRSARHSADHARTTRTAAGQRRCALPVRQPQARRARRAARAGDFQARRSALARPGAALAACAGSRHDRPLGHGGRARRPLPVPGAAAGAWHEPCRSRRGRRRRRAERHHAGARRVSALGRPFGAPRVSADLRADQAAQDDAGLRQHAQPGRDDLPRALAHQRRQPCHRAASWLARCGAAPQGRGRHDRGPAARGRVHLVARSRRRLGRHRSGHQCRRAEGRVASAAAHRPRQPPARRAVARHSHSGQPLRGAGVQRRASARSPTMRRTRRRSAPARSMCWRSMCSGAPAASRSSPTSSIAR